MELPRRYEEHIRRDVRPELQQQYRQQYAERLQNETFARERASSAEAWAHFVATDTATLIANVEQMDNRQLSWLRARLQI